VIQITSSLIIPFIESSFSSTSIHITTANSFSSSSSSQRGKNKGQKSYNGGGEEKEGWAVVVGLA